jgi:hypothetical protein
MQNSAKPPTSDGDMPAQGSRRKWHKSMLNQIQNFVLEAGSDDDEHFVPGEGSQFEDNRFAHEGSQACEDSRACEDSQFAGNGSSEEEDKKEAPNNSTSCQAHLQNQTQPICSMCAASAGDTPKDAMQNADTIPWAHYDTDSLGAVVPVGTSCCPCERARRSDFVVYDQGEFEHLIYTNHVVREFFLARRQFFAEIGSGRSRVSIEATDRLRNHALKRARSSDALE